MARFCVSVIPIVLHNGELFIPLEDGESLPFREYDEPVADVRICLKEMLPSVARWRQMMAYSLTPQFIHGQIELPYVMLLQTDSPECKGVRLYDILPGEDLRDLQNSDHYTALIKHHLRSSALSGVDARLCRILFPADPLLWRPELVMERYRFLRRYGIAENHDDNVIRKCSAALAFLRRGIEDGAVNPALLPERFTIMSLQAAVEGTRGWREDSLRFRRAVMRRGLVQETGGLGDAVQGRPARFYSFRDDAFLILTSGAIIPAGDAPDENRKNAAIDEMFRPAFNPFEIDNQE